GFGLGLIARFDDGVPLRFERMAKHHPEGIFVLDDQDRRIGRRAGSHRTSRQERTVIDGCAKPKLYSVSSPVGFTLRRRMTSTTACAPRGPNDSARSASPS